MWTLGDLPKDAKGSIDVVFTITDTLQPSQTLNVVNRIFDHVGTVRDVTTATLHINRPPQVEWQKMVNGQPWSPALVIRAQTNDVIEVNPVPEPSTIGILGAAGLLGALFIRRRLAKRK